MASTSGYRRDGSVQSMQSMAGSHGSASRDDVSVFEAQDAYLSELLSYSLDRLNKEPELLRADAERVKRQMQDVVVSQYGAFITAAECVKTVSAEVRDLERHLKTLIDGLPALKEGCDSFSDRAHEVVADRAANKQMLSHHGALLDLLEVPQLMDSCVRNGNYDEALDLEGFITKSAVVHGDVGVVHGLVEEVRASTGQMLGQLLARLAGPIQLPECLRVIGYVRRLAVFSEHNLRLQFLQCREVWLQGLVDELDTAHPYDFLKKLTDVHRVHLFDVVMQYRAIFSDDASAVDAEAPAGSAAGGADGGLLFSWSLHRVGAYLDLVRDLLPRITEGGSIASVLEHCMYCGMSLGRVGLDFRNLLAPIFEGCLLGLAARSLGHAVDVFVHVLNTHKWVELPSLQLLPRDGERASEGGEGGEGGGGGGGGGDLSPPYALMEHPPLAVFTNGVLAALNELRHCAPASLRVPVGAALEGALLQVSTALSHFHVTHQNKPGEARLVAATCSAMGDLCVPYLISCYRRLFPSSLPVAIDVARATGPIAGTIESSRAERRDQAAAAAAQAEKEAAAARATAGPGAEPGTKDKSAPKPKPPPKPAPAANAPAAKTPAPTPAPAPAPAPAPVKEAPTPKPKPAPAPAPAPAPLAASAAAHLGAAGFFRAADKKADDAAAAAAAAAAAPKPSAAKPASRPKPAAAAKPKLAPMAAPARGGAGAGAAETEAEAEARKKKEAEQAKFDATAAMLKARHEAKMRAKMAKD